MKKVITWIILIWSVLAIPYAFEAPDFYEFFGGVLYMGLVIYLTISDLKEMDKMEKKKEVKTNGR